MEPQSKMEPWIKYGATSIITALVMLMALYALSKGYHHRISGIEGAEDSYSIFKPFSNLFGKDKEKGKDDSVSQEIGPKQKSKPPKEKSPKENNIVPKDLTITKSDFKELKKESRDKSEPKNLDTSILIGVRQALDERNFSKESKRDISIPSFDTLFIPVYSAENLTDRALKQFQNSFPSADLHRKRFVIEREVASMKSASPATGYEISVYEDRQFLGTFATDEDSLFPFRGLPQILKVEGDPFEFHSRFLVFSDASENTTEVLNTESHLETLLKSVYRSDLDPQMRIGKDPQFGLEIYMLFPGIFIADHLR